MQLLIELFRGCIDSVYASGDVEVTKVDRDNLTEPCSIRTFLPPVISAAKINKRVRAAQNEVDVHAAELEEERKAHAAELWQADNVQFARLLSELKGVGLKPTQMTNLARSMNLTKTELHELFDRAEEAHAAKMEELGLGPDDVDRG